MVRKASRVGDVLDHLQGGDDGEAQALGQQVLGGAGTIGERQVVPVGVDAGCLDRLAGGVQAKDVEAAARQRLGGHPGTAADVEKVKRLRMRRQGPMLPLPLREGVGGRGRRPDCGNAPSPQPPPARGGGVCAAPSPASVPPHRSTPPAPRSTGPAPDSSGAAPASVHSGPTSSPPARRTVQPPQAKHSWLAWLPLLSRASMTTLNRPLTTGTHVTHRDEVRRHLCRRP